METRMSFIETHKPCSVCNSSDGASINEDGTAKCFSCGTFYTYEGGEMIQAPKLVKDNVAILNLTEIHSLRGRETTHLSCINLDCNLSDIEDLLDERLSGWRSHIVTKLENKKITLSYESEFLSDGIISRTS